MIIEIKDLPEGRKVKHINVDITFEEDGVVVKTDKTDKKPYSPTVTITPDDIDDACVDPETPILEPFEESEIDFSSNQRPVVDKDFLSVDEFEPKVPEPIIREKKEIPPEMTDMEF